MTPVSRSQEAASREDVEHLTRRLQDQGTALQSMQADVRHIAKAVDRFAEQEVSARQDAQITREALLEFRTSVRASLKTAQYVWGGIFVLIVVICGMYSAGNEKDKARTDADIVALKADFDRRKLSVDLKIDTVSQQLQEIRLDQQRAEAGKHE